MGATRAGAAGLAAAFYLAVAAHAAGEIEVGNIVGSWPLTQSVVDPQSESPATCPDTIEHVEFTQLAEIEDTTIYSVDFDRIAVDDVTCEDPNPATHRMLVIPSQPAISSLSEIPEIGSFDVDTAFGGSAFVGNTVSNFLNDQLDNQTFLVGVDVAERTCGSYTSAANTPYVFFALEEDFTLFETQDLNLEASKDHMVMLTDSTLCHYSRIRPSETSGPVADTLDKIKECFPAHATVQLESGVHKRMDALAIGDRVLVGPNEYSPVFGFTHRLPEAHSTFIRLTASSGESVLVTPGHYLYANGQPTAAGAIQLGETLELASGACATVSSVTREASSGLYNPQTLHGDVVVDGVRASTYTMAVEPTLAHAGLAALRAAYRALGAASGLLESGAPGVARLMPAGGQTA